MKVSPDDKKVILYKEELAGAGGLKAASANDEVKSYLKNQDTGTGEKLEFPEELLEQAKQAEQEGVSEETTDEESVSEPKE